jgi:hypothetical protein
MRPEIGTASLESPRARHLRGGDRNRIATGAVNSGAHFFERFLFRDSLWNDALLGLAVAGTPWLIVCALNDWCYYNEYGAKTCSARPRSRRRRSGLASGRYGTYR